MTVCMLSLRSIRILALGFRNGLVGFGGPFGLKDSMKRAFKETRDGRVGQYEVVVV